MATVLFRTIQGWQQDVIELLAEANKPLAELRENHSQLKPPVRAALMKEHRPPKDAELEIRRIRNEPNYK